MYELLTYGLLLLAAALAFLDWRRGLLLCVITAFAQDPLRKLVPGEPVYFVLLTGVVFGAAGLGALFKRINLLPANVHGWKANVGAPFAFFMFLVGVQAVHSLLRYGSPMMTGVGLLAYLAPFPAIVFAYQFAVRGSLQHVKQWLWAYVLLGMATLSSIYLEYLGLGWRALGEVGEGLIIYDVGTILTAYSGFIRSSEIAAWHISAIACLLFTLLVGRKISPVRALLLVAVIAVLLSLGMLTGRRKALVVVAVFFCAYFFLVSWFQFHARKPALVAALVGVLAFVLAVGAISPEEELANSLDLNLDPSQRFQLYRVRSASAFENIGIRFNRLGIQTVFWAIDNHGFFGAGLGTGSQGVQHLAVSQSINRGAAEGGLGKITMELGVPGLLLALWFITAFLRYTRKVLEATARLSREHMRFSCALLAFLVANAGSFFVATQAFGDLFILLMLGWSIGFLLAMPVLAQRHAMKEQQRAEARGLPRGLVPLGT